MYRQGVNGEGTGSGEMLSQKTADGGVEIGETLADGGAVDATRELHLAHDVVKKGNFVSRRRLGGAQELVGDPVRGAEHEALSRSLQGKIA